MTMGSFAIIVLLFGSLLILGGIAVVAWRELATHPERRQVGRVRNVVEVLLPVIGIVVLVWAAWAVLV